MTAISNSRRSDSRPRNRRIPRTVSLRIMYPVFKLDQSYPDEALALNRRSLEIDPLNPLTYIAIWASYMDLWDAEQAIAAAQHYREVVRRQTRWRQIQSRHAGAALRRSCWGHRLCHQSLTRLEPPEKGIPAWLPLAVLRHRRSANGRCPDGTLDDMERSGQQRDAMIATEAYRHLVYGEIEEARRLAVSALTAPKRIWGGRESDVIVVRLAVDALIETVRHGGPSISWRSSRRNMPATK